MLHLIVHDVQMGLTEQDHSGISMLHLIVHDVQIRLNEQDDSGIWCYTWLYMMYRWG